MRIRDESHTVIERYDPRTEMSNNQSPPFTFSDLPATTVERENRGKPLSRPRILMADDNTSIMDHVTDILQADYDILGKIADGTYVCSEVERLKPDLIVLDISMGDRSGIEIAHRLQEEGYM